MLLQVDKNALKNYRERTMMTKCKLATVSGLPTNSIYRLESGETSLTSHLRAKEIASALGCKVEDIFTPINKGV